MYWSKIHSARDKSCLCSHFRRISLQGLCGGPLQFGDFEAKIEAVIFGGFEQDLGDVGNGYGLAAAFGDNLFGSFEKLAERVRDAAPRPGTGGESGSVDALELPTASGLKPSTGGHGGVNALKCPEGTASILVADSNTICRSSASGLGRSALEKSARTPYRNSSTP